MREDVLGEIDRRITRLEELIKLAEERIAYLEEHSARYAVKRKDYTLYYLIFMGVWMLLGVLALAALRSDVPYLNLPLGPYALISIVVLLAPVAYVLWSRREASEDPIRELEERERAAGRVVREFYIPLRTAVERNDTAAMIALADRLLGDPCLAGAVEGVGEGDARLNAYALYLYAKYTPELRGDAEELLERLTNKPLRLLLSSRLKE